MCSVEQIVYGIFSRMFKTSRVLKNEFGAVFFFSFGEGPYFRPRRRLPNSKQGGIDVRQPKDHLGYCTTMNLEQRYKNALVVLEFYLHIA